jgi:hypothetical protein
MGSMGAGIEHLLSKLKALSSNPNTAKINKQINKNKMCSLTLCNQRVLDNITITMTITTQT